LFHGNFHLKFDKDIVNIKLFVALFMKTPFLTILLVFISSNFSYAQLIISEYLEGSGNDKCIEIYNTSGSSIDLTGYNLKIYANGSSTATAPNVLLSGSIASCGTFVICHSSAAAGLTGISNQTSANMGYNGDDAVGLYNGTTLLDLFGNIGNDPGAEWTGVGNGTADDGFTRNSTYCTGVTTDPGGTGAGSFTTFTSSNWTSVGLTGATLGSHTSSCGSCGAPITNTITIDAVSSLNYGVDCSTGASGSVDITTTDVFNVGNTYTVELSDASGNFGSPTNIGSLASTSNSVTVNFTIPAGTPTGSGYRIRVVSSNPVVTSPNNGSDITITLTGVCVLEPPHVTSVYINSCNATCDEGFNEVVFGNSGGYAFDVNTTDFNFEYGSNASPASNTSYADVLINNATRIGELNTASGCPGLFIDAAGTTIPANSSWMLAHTGICEEALDWSGLCASGPIYVIFQNDLDWNTNGNFANNNSGMRYLNSRIITTSADVFDMDYNFDSDTYLNSDGVFVQYNSSGGAPVLYGDDDCNLTTVVLPVELYSFNGAIENNETSLYWRTLSEYNFSHFEIFHATDNSVFKVIGNVNAAGNSMSTQNYRMIHPNPAPGINYYQLKAVDIDGTVRNHGTIALKNDIHFLHYNSMSNSIVLDSPFEIEMYNLQGQIVLHSKNEINIPFNQKGVFIIREIESGITQKIVIH